MSKGGGVARRETPAAVVARIVASLAGCYGLAVLWTMAFARFWPGLRADAVLLGTVSSFAVGMLAVIWVFAAASPARACAGLLIPAALLGGLLLLGNAA